MLLGATVWKVEPPPPPPGAITELLTNRGKKSVGYLNLKADADKRTFESLLSVADVLVENYRPGVLVSHI